MYYQDNKYKDQLKEVGLKHVLSIIFSHLKMKFLFMNTDLISIYTISAKTDLYMNPCSTKHIDEIPKYNNFSILLRSIFFLETKKTDYFIAKKTKTKTIEQKSIFLFNKKKQFINFNAM